MKKLIPLIVAIMTASVVHATSPGVMHYVSEMENEVMTSQTSLIALVILIFIIYLIWSMK